jgi:hypothetical protein
MFGHHFLLVSISSGICLFAFDFCLFAFGFHFLDFEVCRLVDANVGLAVGTLVGANDGLEVGRLVGANVGLEVGTWSTWHPNIFSI